MRKLLLVLFLVPIAGFTQDMDFAKQDVDSLKRELAKAKEDSTKVKLYEIIIAIYTFSKPDSAINYIQKQISFAKEIKSDTVLAWSLGAYAFVLTLTGNYPQAMYYALESIKVAEHLNNPLLLASAYDALARAQYEAGDLKNALFYIHNAINIHRSHIPPSAYKNRDTAEMYIDLLMDFPRVYDRSNQLDSALKYLNMVNTLYIQTYGSMKWPVYFHLLGNNHLKRGHYPVALQLYRTGLGFAENFGTDQMDNCNGLAQAYWKMNQTDSSIFYANKVLEISQWQKYPNAKLEALNLLAEIYKAKGNSDSTAKYLAQIIDTKDSVFSQQKVIQMQSMTFGEQMRQQDIIAQQKQYRSKIRTYILVSSILVLFAIAGMLWRNNRQKQRAKAEVELAYQELKATQAQLIQSEKMASLGELTAGIAHEIQNPLNFVNNFSESNIELLRELEQKNDNGDKAEVSAIAQDLIQNEQKILHHGKRAEAIVKSMLEHSRTTKGEQQPTDINALADEYLRLAYHGFRAKDKSFNANIENNYDESIGKINIVPQDIGRVLLNLFNNACYTLAEKNKQSAEDYEPTICVRSKKVADTIEISVRDNGMGISKSLQDKIFQPFFTTKPTGEGTGLGLSLSYDIVKSRGGELKVESTEGEGATFIISLPLS